MSFTIEENTRRKLAAVDHYNPLTGEGCFGTRIETPHPTGGKVLVPPAMLHDAGFRKNLSPLEFDKLRMRHDFEFWCAKCVTVKDKNSCRDIKLRLNRPQRILLAALETMRLQGKPIRVILLKARQCGGSTLIQVYMAWIQLLLRDNWHSLICAHVKDAAATIKGMMSKLTRLYPQEYLPDDVEAFTCTDRTVFDTDGVERQRTFCRPPALTGEVQADAPKGAGALRGVHFVADSTGKLKVWSPPPKHRCRADRFLTVVDIGGRSESSDFSVIAVLDLGEEGDEPPTVAAQWRGHTDHDLLAWKAAQIALWYHRSLLVIESNTLETEMTEGENSGFILHEIADVYPNIYYRHTLDPTTGSRTASVGFHTNRSTKPLIVNHHIAAVRDTAYRERDTEAVNELTTYERKSNGSFGAKDGYHDDILMTRCIGLFIAHELRRNAGTPVTALKRPG